MKFKLIKLLPWIFLGILLIGCSSKKDMLLTASKVPAKSEIDKKITTLLKQHKVPGLAIAIIDNSELKYIQTYGYRSLEKQLPLDSDTVMYAASLTKFVFASYVLSLSNQGLIDLDLSIEKLLPKPLPDYEDYSDLKNDDRWKELTLRNLLSHSTGFPNYRFFPPEGGFDPNGKLKFYFKPNERYGYSGEGYYIAQLVVEDFLNIKVGEELDNNLFKSLNMDRSSMTWKDSFLPNIANGYTIDGELKGHNMRSNARAAGSLDASISDLSKWLLDFINKKDSAPQDYQGILQSNIRIKSPSQFPTLETTKEPKNNEVNLSAGLGVITWESPLGLGFYKGGHNDTTDNLLVCIDKQKRCVILLSNTAKGHLIFPKIVDFILGDTKFPWYWEYS